MDFLSFSLISTIFEQNVVFSETLLSAAQPTLSFFEVLETETPTPEEPLELRRVVPLFSAPGVLEAPAKPIDVAQTDPFEPQKPLQRLPEPTFPEANSKPAAVLSKETVAPSAPKPVFSKPTAAPVQKHVKPIKILDTPHVFLAPEKKTEAVAIETPPVSAPSSPRVQPLPRACFKEETSSSTTFEVRFNPIANPKALLESVLPLFHDVRVAKTVLRGSLKAPSTRSSSF